MGRRRRCRLQGSICSRLRKNESSSGTFYSNNRLKYLSEIIKKSPNSIKNLIGPLSIHQRIEKPNSSVYNSLDKSDLRNKLRKNKINQEKRFETNYFEPDVLDRHSINKDHREFIYLPVRKYAKIPFIAILDAIECPQHFNLTIYYNSLENDACTYDNTNHEERIKIRFNHRAPCVEIYGPNYGQVYEFSDLVKKKLTHEIMKKRNNVNVKLRSIVIKEWSGIFQTEEMEEKKYCKSKQLVNSSKLRKGKIVVEDPMEVWNKNYFPELHEYNIKIKRLKCKDIQKRPLDHNESINPKRIKILSHQTSTESVNRVVSLHDNETDASFSDESLNLLITINNIGESFKESSIDGIISNNIDTMMRQSSNEEEKTASLVATEILSTVVAQSSNDNVIREVSVESVNDIDKTDIEVLVSNMRQSSNDKQTGVSVESNMTKIGNDPQESFNEISKGNYTQESSNASVESNETSLGNDAQESCNETSIGNDVQESSNASVESNETSIGNDAQESYNGSVESSELLADNVGQKSPNFHEPVTSVECFKTVICNIPQSSNDVLISLKSAPLLSNNLSHSLNEKIPQDDPLLEICEPFNMCVRNGKRKMLEKESFCMSLRKRK